MFPAVESPMMATMAATVFGIQTWFTGENNLDHILHGVYVGNIAAAQDLSALQYHGITNVVAATQFGEGARFHPDNLGYHVVNINDLPEEPIGGALDTAVAYIEDARRTGRVLVHCNAGRSRSATIVAAWLLATGRATTVDRALTTIQLYREGIRPNPGFVQQLRDWFTRLQERDTPRYRWR